MVKAVARRIRALNKRIRKATDLEEKIESNPEYSVNKEQVFSPLCHPSALL